MKQGLKTIYLVIAFAGLCTLSCTKTQNTQGDISSDSTAKRLEFPDELKYFREPSKIILTSSDSAGVDAAGYVIGVEINGEARAYPLQIVAFHHVVNDILGGMPIIITYCASCASARVYSATVKGSTTTFHLAGRDKITNNALFVDEYTHSIWLQENGKAIEGPMKGSVLQEIPSLQSTLKVWKRSFPAARIMQRDPMLTGAYAAFARTYIAAFQDTLVLPDSRTVTRIPRVIGVTCDDVSKAYDWGYVKTQNIIHDTIGNIPILIEAQPDHRSFHVFDRHVDGNVLDFLWIKSMPALMDTKTRSLWTLDGNCFQGKLKRKRLAPLQCYQEFRHSWMVFHPSTTIVDDKSHT